MPLRTPAGLRLPSAEIPRRPRLPACFAAGLLLLAVFAPARALAVLNPVEYQLKAGFLFNFAKFVEWPDTHLAPGAEIRLGIVAPDDVYGIMEKALAGKSAGTHALVVQRLTLADLEQEAGLPHIIFLHQDSLRTRQESGILSQLVSLAEKHTVLLVGESPGFANAGGTIGFVQRGENLRFQVNLASAQHTGLKLSARLSGLAEIVNAAQP